MDRLIRALFVALAVGLGWGIRGDFGHELGAAYPGAALGLAFAFVTGQRSMFKWMPILGAVSALGIASGGAMSYGILHGYACSDTLINYSYGYFTLFCQGAAWGVFGCTAMGLLLEKERMSGAEWARLIGYVFLGGFIFYYILVEMCEFHVNPSRSDSSIGHTGAAITLFAWLIMNKKRVGLRAALLGYLGFGIGMFFGRFLANVSYQFPFQINNWNIMEVSAGFFGGLIFTAGMLGYEFPNPPEGKTRAVRSWLDAVCIVFVLAGIPVLHLIRKILMEGKPTEWVKRFAEFNDRVYENPEAMSQHVLHWLYVVCAFAVAGAVVWILIHRKQGWELRAFPVLYLSLIMIFFQNISALRFWYDVPENYVNMHTVFWVLFVWMVAAAIYVYAARPFPTRNDEEMARLPWKEWVAGTVALYLVVLILAHLGVNGEKTMKSARTRWPEWSASDGPFPGRQK